MQLIQLSEPASIDIKKTMSTLGGACEGNLVNGAIVDIASDVISDIASDKISPSKKDTVSKAVENTTKEQKGDEAKGLNGIVKTNGDDFNKENKTLALDETKTDQIIENISTNGKSNGASSVSSSAKASCKDSCKSSINISADLINTTDKETNSEKTLSLFDVKQETEVSYKLPELTLNNNDGSDVKMLEVENSHVADTQADVCSKQVPNADKLKNVQVSVESDTVQTVSAFSPNSDANEKEINISAQLQQLEDDETFMELSPMNDSTKDNITTKSASETSEMDSESINGKPALFVEKKQNMVQPTTTEQSKNNEVNSPFNVTTSVENPPIENNDQNIASKVADKKLDTSVDKISLVKLNEDKFSTDLVNQNSSDITNDTNKKNEIPAVNIEEPVENDQKLPNSVINMEVDHSESVKKIVSDSVKSTVYNTPKYVTVKNLSDMTYPSTNKTIENSETNKILNDLQQIDKDQTQQSEVMEVDASDVVLLDTPENSVSLNVSEKIPINEKKTEDEDNIEKIDKETTKDTVERNNTEASAVPIEKQQSETLIKKSDDVMEIEDIDHVEENLYPDSVVDKNQTDNATSNLENCNETAKQDSIINIVDNDDEEKNNASNSKVKNKDISDVISIDDNVKDLVSEESKEISIQDKVAEEKKPLIEENPAEKTVVKELPVVCKLSNTMDILSDEEDEPPIVKSDEEDKTVNKSIQAVDPSRCINLDDDDDIMFIEDNSQSSKNEENVSEQQSDAIESKNNKTADSKLETAASEMKIQEADAPETSDKDDSTPIEVDSQPKAEDTKAIEPSNVKDATPIISKTFLKSVTKNLADLTRNELEDFCILKLVESVVDKSNLNEIKNKMKVMTQTIEDLRKKAFALTKQNRDLQVVVKTVQEDQKKRSPVPMMPMKITRSVGMQVVLNAADKNALKKKLTAPPVQAPPTTPTRPTRNMQSPKSQKPVANNIPVPRLVPASSPTVKSPAAQVNTATKPNVPCRNTTPQRPEKRPHNKVSPGSSVTVDLTDDEPPAKAVNKNPPPPPPVRLVPSQNLMPPKTRPPFGPASVGNGPRKVYIPISSNTQNNIRPAMQTVMKNFVPAAPRPRQASVVRMQSVRLNTPSTNRHPAPLPEAMKQYQPPTWKALPPAPDLKLSKVDNGIVISWKFEGYQPDTYEEVASFQLYAYQETPAPPSTALWKKIGDIKALPLPMACTLTQFMSGFKYYFAVRAIDVRSRIGPFSLPGSIMLISKS